MSEERAFDMILWGATGFTGKLVAEYLATHYGTPEKPLRWAIAGRNPDKLEALRNELSGANPTLRDLPILTGDSQDRDSLDTIARQTKVICTTVGPYIKYGGPLVAACVDAGTHYCDLTGETPFIHEMIDLHHDTARSKKLRIVHCCGYDSIPSDLGCWMVQEAFKERTGAYASEVKYFAGPTRGGFSGGTAASLLEIVTRAQNKAVRRILGHPYALNPKDGPTGPDGSDQSGVRWDDDIQRWTGPFVMAAINTRVVRRSHALRGFPYGEDFRYSEVMSMPKGFRGWMRAAMLTVGLGGFVTLASLSFTRKLLQKTVLPAPGEGPSEEARKKGYFNTYLVAKGDDQTLYGLVHGDKDPGYGSTAIMLAESAICLAQNQDQLPACYGVVTPASAMGQPLLERLRRAGISFTISDTFPPKRP